MLRGTNERLQSLIEPGGRALALGLVAASAALTTLGLLLASMPASGCEQSFDGTPAPLPAQILGRLAFALALVAAFVARRDGKRGAERRLARRAYACAAVTLLALVVSVGVVVFQYACWE